MAFLNKIFPLSSQYLQETGFQSSEPASPDLVRVLKNLAVEESDRVVIVGPDRADKTSLVFQAAVSAAASGIKTTHICTHSLKCLPAPVHGMVAPEPNVMKNVDFLYLEGVGELIGWCAGVHTRANLPSFVIIEDILTYASQLNNRSLERSLARLCATINDAAEWVAAHNDSKRCPVLMTAPTRIASMTSVLSQFDFKTAAYQGPLKSDPDSQLSYESELGSINIRFCHRKDDIFVTNVSISKASSSKEVTLLEDSKS